MRCLTEKGQGVDELAVGKINPTYFSTHDDLLSDPVPEIYATRVAQSLISLVKTEEIISRVLTLVRIAVS